MSSSTFFSFRGNWSSARLSSLLMIWSQVSITPNISSNHSLLIIPHLNLVVVFTSKHLIWNPFLYLGNFPLWESWWETETSSHYTSWKYRICCLHPFSVSITAGRQSGDLGLANYAHVLDFELEINNVRSKDSTAWISLLYPVPAGSARQAGTYNITLAQFYNFNSIPLVSGCLVCL